MPQEKVEQLERTAIFKGFPKDTKESNIVEVITANLGEHANEVEGKAYTTTRWRTSSRRPGTPTGFSIRTRRSL
eukprot:33965-Pyramimonas_sp.AAC.1